MSITFGNLAYILFTQAMDTALSALNTLTVCFLTIITCHFTDRPERFYIVADAATLTQSTVYDMTNIN